MAPADGRASAGQAAGGLHQPLCALPQGGAQRGGAARAPPQQARLPCSRRGRARLMQCPQGVCLSVVATTRRLVACPGSGCACSLWLELACQGCVPSRSRLPLTATRVERRWDVEVVNATFVAPLRDAISLMQGTDLLIGMHGAGAPWGSLACAAMTCCQVPGDCLSRPAPVCCASARPPRLQPVPRLSQRMQPLPGGPGLLAGCCCAPVLGLPQRSAASGKLPTPGLSPRLRLSSQTSLLPHRHRPAAAPALPGSLPAHDIRLRARRAAQRVLDAAGVLAAAAAAVRLGGAALAASCRWHGRLAVLMQGHLRVRRPPANAAPSSHAGSLHCCPVSAASAPSPDRTAVGLHPPQPTP